MLYDSVMSSKAISMHGTTKLATHAGQTYDFFPNISQF